MDYETALKTCSEEVRAAIRWLEDHIRFNKETLERKIEEEKDREWVKEEISRRLAVKYLCSDAIVFYVLSKVKSPRLNEFLEAAKSEEFWLRMDENEIDAQLSDYPPLLFYLAKLGLNSNEYFEEAVNLAVKNQQTVKGVIGSDFYHTGPMRDLIAIEPNSEATDMAVRYFLSDLVWFKNHYQQAEIALGVLALYELDFLKFKEIIGDLATYLKNTQHKEGYWGTSFIGVSREVKKPIVDTAYVTEALSRVFGSTDECVIKAIEWLKSNQEKDGSWKNSWDGASGQSDDYWRNYWAYPVNTAHACLALMSVGEGPKIPLEEVEWQEMLTKQELKHAKPHFVQTSPEYYEKHHIEDIQKTIRAMFQSAESELKILSPHFELLHDELIKMLADKPDLILQVITRPKEEQARHNQKIIDLLNKHTKGNCRSNWKLHARMVIVDNREVLISSSDLDRNGLIDQYNAGIWTRDEETVEAAVKFFENLWTESGDETA